jgi:hypothetical protein
MLFKNRALAIRSTGVFRALGEGRTKSGCDFEREREREREREERERERERERSRWGGKRRGSFLSPTFPLLLSYLDISRHLSRSPTPLWPRDDGKANLEYIM